MKTDDSSRDETFDPEVLDAAVNERPVTTEAPEIDARTQSLTAWDEAPASTGERAEKSPLEDEASIEAKLVDEGLDIADSEQRIASADPDSV